MLRDYQQEAFEIARRWMSETSEPGLIEAATGSGKSHVIAAVAECSEGRTLCIQPSKELVYQNYQKFLATGEPASLYCASLNQKSLKHRVVFGSPQSINRSIKKFQGFDTIIIDEAHGITPTIKGIIAQLNPKSILGLTATPYRLGSGYIYRYDERNRPVPEYATKEPYFNTLLCRVTARDLLNRGFLTPITSEVDHVEGYHTAHLRLDKKGQFNTSELNLATTSQSRKTALIIQDVIAKTADRLGVMLFATSVQHAEEIMHSLPGDSALITGKTPQKEREHIINQFKAMRIKYLVNVSVLTTGFDAPHVDAIALLRPTESVGLLQQIIGRGMRLSEGKADCLFLDYAENVERHCPDGDIFNPSIKAHHGAETGGAIHAECPVCQTVNEFAARKNDEEFKIDHQGYFVDLLGKRIQSDFGPIPAHHGRRCYGQVAIGQRCKYRWTFKECLECEAENDIAARYCCECKAEIVDPNEKLRLEFAKIKKDPYHVSTDPVLNWKVSKHVSNAGNDTVRIDWVTEYRTFSAWYQPKQKRIWDDLSLAVFNKVAPDVDKFLGAVEKYGKRPSTITASKDKQSGFFRIYGHNRPADIDPSVRG
jgi:DNA repair protein RadD